MPIPPAADRFLRNFEAFERHSVNVALRSLTADERLLEQAPRRLGLQARLTLLKRLSMARWVEKAALNLLDHVIARSAQLQRKYDALVRITVAQARNESRIPPNVYVSDSPVSQRLWLPTDEEINDYDEQTGDLRRHLESFVERLNSEAPRLSPDPGDKSVNNADSSAASH